MSFRVYATLDQRLPLSRVYLGLNRLDLFFAELDRAYSERNVLIYLPQAPEFDSVRQDPRFQSILKKLDRGNS